MAFMPVEPDILTALTYLSEWVVTHGARPSAWVVEIRSGTFLLHTDDPEEWETVTAGHEVDWMMGALPTAHITGATCVYVGQGISPDEAHPDYPLWRRYHDTIAHLEGVMGQGTVS